MIKQGLATTNFHVSIKTIYFRPDDEVRSVPARIRATITLSGGQALDWTTPPEKFNCRTLLETFPQCAAPSRQAIAFADFEMKNALANTLAAPNGSHSAAGIYFEYSGLQCLTDGTVCYVAGDTVLGELLCPFLLSPQLQGFQLHAESDISSAVHFSNLLRENKEAAITWAYTILSSLQSAVLDTGVPLQSILYLYGPQGLGKTTLAQRFCCLYVDKTTGRPHAFHDAASTMAATLDSLCICRDMPVLVDDLCLSSSRATQRKRLDLGANLIRLGANKSAVSKKQGGETNNRTSAAGLILTAEFTMDTLSESTRCILLPVEEPQTGSVESDQQAAASTLYALLSWFVDNYESECISLRRSYQSFQNDPSRPREYVRLQVGLFALMWAWKVYLAFRVSTDRLTLDIAATQYKQMKKWLATLWKEQYRQLKALDRKIPKQSACEIVWALYARGELELVKNPQKLFKKRCDGIKHKGHLYLLPDTLLARLRTCDGYQTLTKTQLSRQLAEANVLSFQAGNGYTVKLGKGLPRTYRIDLDALQDCCH